MPQDFEELDSESLNNECSLDHHGRRPDDCDVACLYFKECDCAAACCCPTTSNLPGKPTLVPPSAPSWAVLETRFKRKLAKYQEAPHHAKAAKLELVLGDLQGRKDDASESTQTKLEHRTPCIYSMGQTLSDSPLTDSANTQQWSRTWSSISPDVVAKILAVPSSQLSQEGCVVIEMASHYFEMVSQTSRLIRVHAMLLWNAFLDRDDEIWTYLFTHSQKPEAGTPEAFYDDRHAILNMVPIACFQLACKLCGGHGFIAPRSSHLMGVATDIWQQLQGQGVTITETINHPSVRLTGHCVLFKAELRVLAALDWDITMVLEIDQAENLVAHQRVRNLNAARVETVSRQQ